jgi:hypothetical protein
VVSFQPSPAGQSSAVVDRRYELASEVRTAAGIRAHAGPHVPRVRTVHANSHRAQYELASEVRARGRDSGSRGSARPTSSHRARQFAPCTVRTRVGGTNSRRRCEPRQGFGLTRVRTFPEIAPCTPVRTVHRTNSRQRYELASEVRTRARCGDARRDGPAIARPDRRRTCQASTWLRYSSADSSGPVSDTVTRSSQPAP